MKRPGKCWFAGRPGAGPCSGELQRAHWIKQQVIRREVPAGDECPRCGASRGRPCVSVRDGTPLREVHAERKLGQQAVVWDRRVWDWMCEGHHRALDHARTLRVARADLPSGVEEFARERDALVPGDREPLQAWLDLEYGPREWRIPLRSRAGIVGHALVSEGDFEAVNAYPWHRDADGYAVRNVRRDGESRHVRMGRVVLGLADDDPREADHINGDRLDNRRENLRAVTHAENQQNQHADRGGSSRHRGVDWFEPRGKWRAQGRANGRKVQSGSMTPRKTRLLRLLCGVGSTCRSRTRRKPREAGG